MARDDVDPGAEVAADQQRPQRLGRAAGGGQQIGHRRAEGELVDAGAATAPEIVTSADPGIGLGAELAKPVGRRSARSAPAGPASRGSGSASAARDSRARTAAAARRWAWAPPCEVVEHGGLLAGDVPLGAGDELEAHRRLRAGPRARPRAPAPPRWRSSPTLTITSRAPTARAASTAPSSTRCGSRASSSRSLPLAGSVSTAVDDHRQRAAALGDRAQLDRGREVGATASAQAAALDGRRSALRPSAAASGPCARSCSASVMVSPASAEQPRRGAGQTGSGPASQLTAHQPPPVRRVRQRSADVSVWLSMFRRARTSSELPAMPCSRASKSSPRRETIRPCMTDGQASWQSGRPGSRSSTGRRRGSGLRPRRIRRRPSRPAAEAQRQVDDRAARAPGSA